MLDPIGEERSLLDRSPVDEQKNLLRCFVDKIEMSESEVKLHYKIPVLASDSPQEEVNFLPFIRHGEGAGGEVISRLGTFVANELGEVI